MKLFMLPPAAAPLLLLLFGLAAETSGHGAVTFPPPRNAIDADMAPWNGSVPTLPINTMFRCPSPSAEAAGTNPHNLTFKQGQACFWFSNGCDLSCDECDGTTGSQPINLNPKFVSDANLTGSWWTGKGIMPDPNAAFPSPHAICKNGTSRKPTICDPKLRTVNTNTECGSPLDFCKDLDACPGPSDPPSLIPECHAGFAPSLNCHSGAARRLTRSHSLPRRLLRAVAGPRPCAGDRRLWDGRGPMARPGPRD